jgi:DNA-binding response OmpR family regulator
MSRPVPVAAPVVLLVQPDDDGREMYAEYLQHHRFAVRCAADVGEAAALAREASVIVTELYLPGSFDGCAFIQRLRADADTRTKPIIVLTSRAWQTDKLRARDAGCDLFLTKPCLPHVMLHHVRQVLAAARARGASAVPPANV